jgi:hypothetical protein
MMRESGCRSRISQVVAIAVLVLIYTISAQAQSPVQLVPPTASVPSQDTPKTITNISSIVLPTGNYSFAKIMNQSSTDTIRCRWGTSSAVSSDTAGQYTILSYSGYIWDASDPPPLNQSLSCISTGASTPATVKAY